MIRDNLESSFFAQVFMRVIDINKSEQIETAPPMSGK